MRPNEVKKCARAIGTDPVVAAGFPTNFGHMVAGPRWGIRLLVKIASHAPRDERRWVAGFNQYASLLAEGASDAMDATITSAVHLVPDPSAMAFVCKPGVLRFLSGINMHIIRA